MSQILPLKNSIGRHTSCMDGWPDLKHSASVVPSVTDTAHMTATDLSIYTSHLFVSSKHTLCSSVPSFAHPLTVRGNLHWLMVRQPTGIAETNRIQLVLLGMQNRTLVPIWQPSIGSSFSYPSALSSGWLCRRCVRQSVSSSQTRPHLVIVGVLLLALLA
jgi:hypothetical protein